jgi:predicted DNA-binding WGR domain protein
MILHEFYDSKALDKRDLELPEVKTIKSKFLHGAYTSKDALDDLIEFIPEQNAKSVILDWQEEQEMLWETKRRNSMNLKEKTVELELHSKKDNSHKYYTLKSKGKDKFEVKYGRLDGYGRSGTEVDGGIHDMSEWDSLIASKKKKGYRESTSSPTSFMSIREAKRIVTQAGYTIRESIDKDIYYRYQELINDDYTDREARTQLTEEFGPSEEDDNYAAFIDSYIDSEEDSIY